MSAVPELQVSDDILYLRKSLVPVRQMKEQEASRRMADLIVEALKCKTTQMNDAVHILVHQVTATPSVLLTSARDRG